MSGRPSTFTLETADAICLRLSAGESLRSICADEQMPGQSTVYQWLNANEAFAEQYTRAREAQADTIFDEILDIADDGHNDWMLRKFGEDERYVENGEAIRRSTLRIDARKWVAGKLAPKKYSDKLQHEVTGKDGKDLVPEASPTDIAKAIVGLLHRDE